jgi:hypothetical protein
MEQFIGCDAHQKFSVFVAVNEKGQAGEAIRWSMIAACIVSFSRNFLNHQPSRSRPADLMAGWSTRRSNWVIARSGLILWRPSGGWARPRRPTSWTPPDWRSCCVTELCGGQTRMGQVCGNVNRNLKWALVEAGNLVVIYQRRLAGSHVVRLYQRIQRAKNHPKAVVAVARHLAEASYWVLTKQEV